MIVSISEDYNEKPIYEKTILGKYLLKKLNFEKTEILLLWRRLANKNYLEKFKNLKAVIRYGTGYDNVDINYLKKHNIKLYNNPDYCLDEVSDTVLALIISRIRRLNDYEKISRDILNHPKNYLFKNTIDQVQASRSKNIGVIGAGRIGTLVLKKAEVFFDNIGYFDPFTKNNKLRKYKSFRDIKSFLRWADVISINANLNSSNRHLINKNFLQNLKKDTILINLARYEFIENIEDIFQSIKNNKLDYFAIDVEMRDLSNKKKIIKDFLKSYSDQFTIHPHSSFYSRQSYIRMRTNTANIALNLINNKNLKKNLVKI